MTPAIRLQCIALTLRAGRFDLHDEKTCQSQIGDWLCAHLLDMEILREHRLSPRDIPDFLIAGIVVEVKMNGARGPAIFRQLERYSAHDTVTGLILATNRAVTLPATVGGKPLAVVSLGRAWL